VILRAFERGLDGVLLGWLGRDASAEVYLAFEIRFDDGGFAWQRPSDAPSGASNSWRVAEGNDGHVGRDRGHGDMRVIFCTSVDDEFVVISSAKTIRLCWRLVRQFARAFFLSRLSRSVVGIDQHDAARSGRDLFLDVVEVGLPAVFFVEVIVFSPISSFARTAE